MSQGALNAGTYDNMTLTELLEEAGIEEPPPWPFLDLIQNVQIHFSSREQFLATARFHPGTEDVLIDLGCFRAPIEGVQGPVLGFIATVKVNGQKIIDAPMLYFISTVSCQVCYVSTFLEQDGISKVNSWLLNADVDVTVRLPFPPRSGPGEGLKGWLGSVSTGLNGGTVPLLVFNPPETKGGTPRIRGPLPARASEVLNYVWGALRVTRVGGGFSERDIYVSFDAELKTGPLTWVAGGLGLSLALDGSWEVGTPFYGLSCHYLAPAAVPVAEVGKVEIFGQLMRIQALEEDFTGVPLAGHVLVQIGDIVGQAAGAYARHRDGWSSLFLYLEVLLGERFFPRVGVIQPTGGAIGFGINSTVRVPNASDIRTFPLVRRLDDAPTSPTDPTPPPLESLPLLASLAGPGGWITPAEGQYWGAGGISLVLFKFIDTRLLLLVEGGKEWKVMLAGSVSVNLPRPPSPAGGPIGRIIVIAALTYEITRRRFSMDVAIGDGSYVLDKRVSLHGGLSLRVWPDELFMVSLGGYHPQYRPPEGFPTPPPRIGATLQASSAVTIKGELYAALVPRAAMGGFELALLFDVGGAYRIEAWLTSRAHLMVQWDPFFVDGTVGVRVGVAGTVKVLFVKVRISLELGVDLSFWGGDDWPFGGVAQIKVWFVSFRIPFGSERKGAPPINWDDFAIQLPRPVKVNLEDGQSLPDRYTPVPDRWVRDGTEDAPTLVTSQGFRFSTFSSLSANRLEFNGNPFPLAEGTPPPKANIRPMDMSDVDSVHKVTLRRKSRPNELYDPRQQDGWVIREYRVAVSQAMWGQAGGPSFEGPELVTGRLGGLRFIVPPPVPGPHVGPVSAAALDVSPLPERYVPLRVRTVQGPQPVVDEDSVSLIGGTIAEAAQSRTRLHRELLALGIALDPHANDDLDGYADDIDNQFVRPPLTTTAV
ncbi:MULTISPECIES: DUF6603 domain-containing protein [Streptomycetaceae]|nr:DUF6603 domain-containing protein [Streptomyces filipinensis]